MTHVGVKEHPRLCPGDLDTQEVEKKSAHPLKQNESGIVNTVGCHVILKHKDTNKRAYAIIPACNKCNKADRSKRHHDTIGNLRWYCKAVTILEEDAFTNNFVGKITVPVKDSKGKPRKVWWQDIMDIMDVSGACADGTTRTKTLTIRGYTNIDKERPGTPHACNDCKFGEDSNYKNEKFLVCSGQCKRRQYTYSNPAGYLQKIASLWKYGPNVALGNHGVLKNFENKFKPCVLRCQEEMYPGKNPVEYKKAYGLCTNKGCHKDSLPRAELCKEHLLRKYFARLRDDISKRRARAAEAVANEVLNILLKQLDDLLIQ